MSDNVNLVLEFSRHIPEPFDAFPRKGNYASKHSSVSSGTLCGGIVKMVLNACEVKAGNKKGGVGIVKSGSSIAYCVSEYESSVSDEMHLIVYNCSKGTVNASVYNTLTANMEQYKCGPKNRDGTAILFALFPLFMAEDEFKTTFDKIYNSFINGWSDLDAAYGDMLVICDNVYRRLKDDSLASNVTLNLDKAGNLSRVQSMAIKNGTYEPEEVILGGFEIFSTKSNTTPKKTKSKSIQHSDFIGKYPLSSNRTLTAKERTMVPSIPSHIIITKEALSMCKLAHETTGKFCAQRNFLLRGGAGTGKTCTAKQVAAGLGLPLVTLTCHPDLSMDELIGVMLPKTNENCEGDAEVLESMGGVTPENIAKLLNLPDLDTIEFDPEEAYKKLTGVEKPDATQQECFYIYMDAIANKLAEVSSKPENKTGTEYVFVEGVLLQAIKYGWVCELQEPTVIARPGVLAGLNSILEQEGNITLPDGRVIVRHPDAVVIATTNVSYEGCRGLNQSVVDRMNQVYDVETPELNTMVKRAMSVTGETDETTVRLMAEVVCDVAEYCKKNCITDGVTGMRVLIDWVASYQATGDAYESALNTVIAKATSDADEQVSIRTEILDPVIAPASFKNN